MPSLLIAVIGSILIVIIAIVARVPTYHVNPIFLVPLLWLPYWLRKRIDLRWPHYLLFAVAILFHDLGAFGFYQNSPFTWSFDIYVHFCFAFAIVLVLHHAIASNFPMLKPWQFRVTTLMFMMGFGALHEIMEYVTYLLLGEQKGMLKPTTSYVFDTARDLTNNLLGTLTALAIISIHAAVAARRRVQARGFDPILPHTST